MGKALVFKGIKVDTPLQVVTFVKELITASDYVNEYSKLATSVSSEQKTNLVTFVKTLMSNNLWDKVKCCFPMLGGMDGYNKDLKDVFNQRVWKAPDEGTSWDSTRNAPYLNLPGNAKGTELVIENMNRTSSSFLFSIKIFKNTRDIMYSKYVYNGDLKTSIINRLSISAGGYKFFSWNTPDENKNIKGYSFDKQCNNIYMITMNNDTNSTFACSNNTTLLEGSTSTTPESEATNATFAFGGFYSINYAAPAPSTLNGTMNMFIAFDSALTKQEWEIVSKAVWDFDEACGRHIDFTD